MAEDGGSRSIAAVHSTLSRIDSEIGRDRKDWTEHDLLFYSIHKTQSSPGAMRGLLHESE